MYLVVYIFCLFDQHFLLALIAPRKIFLSTAHEDIYSDPLGEFYALKGVQDIYKLYNSVIPDMSKFPAIDQLLEGDIGYRIRKGIHELTPDDWRCLLIFLKNE